MPAYPSHSSDVSSTGSGWTVPSRASTIRSIVKPLICRGSFSTSKNLQARISGGLGTSSGLATTNLQADDPVIRMLPRDIKYAHHLLGNHVDAGLFLHLPDDGIREELALFHLPAGQFPPSVFLALLHKQNPPAGIEDYGFAGHPAFLTFCQISPPHSALSSTLTTRVSPLLAFPTNC